MSKALRRVLELCVLSVVLLTTARVHAQAREDDAELKMMLRQWLLGQEVHREPALCTEGCYVLSSLSIRGAVDHSLSFELRGSLLAQGPVKVALFGPASDVRLDELTLDGERPVLGFEEDHYYLLTSAKAFTLRGRITLGADEMITVVGPLVGLDAELAQGRIVEGNKLSGLANTTLHFDPMTPESASEAEARTPKVFRLAREVKIAKETGFVYRLTMSRAQDLGVVHLPLRYGERVDEVSGAAGWSRSGDEILLPTNGKSADVTITGILTDSAAKDGVRTFRTDERSTYEWWMVESDPDFQVETAGDGKPVENAQSPIPPSLPTARTYLVQRGQRLEVEAHSLVRGDVLAAVARSEKRFVSITPQGEMIGDETIAYDNNGLEHLIYRPAGQPIYLSTDGRPGRILHTQAGASEMLVPMEVGSHRLRVQSLAQVRLFPFAGMVSMPMADAPLTTSVVDVTVGVPRDVLPVALLGGDVARWIFARADGVAALLGVALACFGFRSKKTRILGSLATVGLWWVSREAFVYAGAGLFLVGAAFLASRFLRGNALFAASAAALIVSLFGARAVLAGDVVEEPKRELFVLSPTLPQPETSGLGDRITTSLEVKTGATPVSLSLPTSERYVQTSRQIVTSQRPFVPRLLYVTPALLAALEVAWLGLVGALAYAHRQGLAALWVRVKERLARRVEPREPHEGDAQRLPRW
ncbi:MAG TPA: hypothetical protein VGI39_20130 [Polyangiaceae bacterium]